MRESNFAFPAQNKACVCITSQLYDRRALDTTSPLPLFNSLTHLTYLTSTSPRIREIMTMDGGLERLVRILHEFCMCPPPPENPAILYGLTPPNARLAKLTPALNPHSFDKHAAYRFSLAFQCIVNIGVRGSEPIRSRVVQAGTLDVVGCILEAWLANKGFAVGPSSSATGLPRETREQRQQRRLAHLEQRQREEAAHLQRALQRQLQVERRRSEERDESMDYSPGESSTSHILLLSDSFSQPSNSNSDTDVSADNSIAVTPQGSGTPTGSVVVPSRDRSGTIIARPVWDQPAVTTAMPPRGRRNRHRELPPESPSLSTDASRAETETEDDGDVDIDMDHTEESERIDSDVASASASPSPERRPRTRLNLTRRAVGIVSDEPNAGPQTLQVGGLGLDTDAHIIINEAGAGDGGVGVEVGVEDGIVSLEPNDDFAMGAPPGAPGALGEGTTPRGLNLNNIETGRRRNTVDAPDVTPRAAVIGLPMMPGASTNGALRGANQPTATHGHQRTATLRGRPAADAAAAAAQAATGAATPVGTPATAASLNAPLGGLGGGRTTSSSGHGHHHRDADSGPYRDEDVLLSLQLLAYLSKYPHVRQAFYKPRVTFHPASVNLPGARFGVGQTTSTREREKQREREKEREREKAGTAGASTSTSGSGLAGMSSGSTSVKEGFFRAFNAATGSSRGKERAGQQPSSTSQTPVIVAPATGGAPSSARQTNVFSLVERFTFKPSSTETDLPNPPPRLPPEIQYWAGVIMRNACRKDDSRGGIRQCANMMCGKWETYPREFAKCRRCRKAKYCGKECQSTAWSEGHRFWCSAKDVDEDNLGDHSTTNAAAAPANTDASADSVVVEGAGDGPGLPPNGTATGTRTERQRPTRERGHGPHAHNHHGVTAPTTDGDASTLRGYRLQPSVPTALTVLQGPASTYVTPTPSTSVPMSPTTTINARAESSITRDRTLQAPSMPAGPSRSRPNPHTRPSTTQDRDPTNTNYLAFQMQANTLVDQGTSHQRRRAETITGPLGSSTSSSSSRTTNTTSYGHHRVERNPGVPPHFLRGDPVTGVITRPAAGSNEQASIRVTQPFPAWGSALIGMQEGAGRRREEGARRSPPSEDERDHMVLG